MRSLRVILCTLFIWIYSIPIHSKDTFFFSQVGIANGLSQASVMCIFQDYDGFLWIGTRNGVNRFDGYRFVTYQTEVNNPNSISDGDIFCVSQDNEKNIWVGTLNGLNRFCYMTDNITRFYPQQEDENLPSNTIYTFLRHSDGYLYAFGEESVWRCYPDKQPERMDYLKEIPSAVYSICQNANGDICVGSAKHGVYIYTKDWTLTKHIPMYLNTGFCTVRSIAPFENNTFLAGTENKGLFIVDSNEEEYTGHFTRDNSGLNNNTIRAITSYENDSIVLGTFGGLHILDKTEKNIIPITVPANESGGVNHFSIHSLLHDRDGTLWVGTYSGGLNFYSRYFKPITFIKPDNFSGLIGKGVEDNEGNLWFATEGKGLMHYNTKTGKQTFYPLFLPLEGNYEENIIKSVLYREPYLYCTTHFGGVYRFSLKNKTYTLFHDSDDLNIFNLFIDSRNRLWVPTMGEEMLVMFDQTKKTNQFPANGGVVNFRRVSIINEIERDVFLFGTIRDSLYLYDTKKKTAENIADRLADRQPFEKLGTISAILVYDDCLWIGTTKSGLYKLNKELQLIKHFQQADGLSETRISNLIVDLNNDLWVITGNNIYKLNQEQERFFLIRPENVPRQEFSIFSAVMTRNGTIYIPGNRGIYSFSPHEVAQNQIPPAVYITSVYNNHDESLNELLEMEEISSLQYRYNIRLTARQRNLTIMYTALNFIHSEESKFAYKMEGLDNDWIRARNRRVAYYSNMKPGKYAFRLLAANDDGMWSPREAILHITITPPLYKTWWAYGCYVLAIFSFLGWIYYYNHQKHELKRDIRYKQMEKDKIKELHEERMRMYGNFSHELRTPLTLIINPINELMRKASFSQEVKEALTLIKKNTQRMLLIVNNLMDVQKYEAGKGVLNKNFSDFSLFMHEIYRSFESVAHNRHIQFEIKSNLPDTYSASYDEIEMEKVMYNLLSNAFKFTPSGGTVTLVVNSLTEKEVMELPSFPAEAYTPGVTSRYIYIEVIDTGKGFTKEDARKIFEPFFRAGEDVRHEIEGTGIGLNLARSIVWQHSGYIWTYSSQMEGTHFIVLLPDQERPDIALTEEIPLAGEEQEKEDNTITEKVTHLVEEARKLGRNTLLLVEDNPDMLFYLEQQLMDEYTIFKATNGKEALEKIEEIMPQMVISDVMMPFMSGLELCKHIKEDSRLEHIPVILLTAKSMIPNITEGLMAEADDYIIKPFEISVLKARIKNILSLREKMKTVYSDPLSLSRLGLETTNEDKEFLAQYIEFVKNNISNPNLDITDIYEALHMSRANFYRKVKTVTGLSPLDLIRNIRLEAAVRLLRESTLNVTEVAQQVGFANRSYFTRLFKTTYGVSPSDFQKQQNNK